MKLTQTLRSWAKKYGSEAAFVGRVAVAAFVPPGASVLIEKGLEAAFEYIQSQPEQKVNDLVLSQRMDEVGLSHEQAEHFSQLIHQVDESAGGTLEHAFHARQAGDSRSQIESHLRHVIAQDPTLLALRNTLEHVSNSLNALTKQGEVLIAGQAYQAAALEEMMHMIRNIAQQVNHGQGILTPIPTPTNPVIDPLSLIDHQQRSDQLFTQETPSALDALDQLTNVHDPQKKESTLKVKPASATALANRFKELTQAKSTNYMIFSELSDQSEQVFDCPQVGNGRVALSLLEVGDQPLLIVKWLCESWSYSLADALIATQNTPVIIKRSDQFVQLGQAQKNLASLGAKLKLKT